MKLLSHIFYAPIYGNKLLCVAETEGFQIDTMRTFSGMTLKSVTEGPTAPVSRAAPQTPSHRPTRK